MAGLQIARGWPSSLGAWHPASLDDGIRDRNPDGERKSSAAMGRSFY